MSSAYINKICTPGSIKYLVKRKGYNGYRLDLLGKCGIHQAKVELK